MRTTQLSMVVDPATFNGGRKRRKCTLTPSAGWGFQSMVAVTQMDTNLPKPAIPPRHLHTLFGEMFDSSW